MATTLFAQQSENGNEPPDNVGLTPNQVTLLIDSIVQMTNTEYSEGSLKRSLDVNRHDRIKSFERYYKNSQIKVSSNIIGLKLGFSKRLIEAMVPNGEMNPESVVKLCRWALGNRIFLHETYVLLPVLKWVNCILHYNLCSTDLLENAYELFLQSLDVISIVSISLFY